MKKLVGLVFNGVVLAIIGLVAFALLVWIVGPLVSIGQTRVLETETSRIVLIAAVVLLYLAVKAWQAWRARRVNQRVVRGLMGNAAQQAPAAAPGPGEAEVQTLRERFDAALATLEKARFENAKGVIASVDARLGKRYLYQLPWYVIVGAPGSGKTTALMNAGLRFPLADKAGTGAVPGVGGTRNCDWWFTSEAVLIDTAGRYTTQDSHREADSTAWQGFLDLLKRSRPRQPVNGVLLTVSVSDLLTRSAEQRAAHAAALRARVQELHERLGIRFPVYVLVTKSDLVSGFTERFGDLDAETRAEPWGISFPLDAAMRSNAASFPVEFDALVGRLHDGLVDRLEREPDHARRVRIYGFAQQFAALRPLLVSFLDTVFASSQFEEHPLLRGVYFISGTQEGTPIDRIMGQIGRAHGLEHRLVPANAPSGRSFFLTLLLREVVFAEAGLAGTNLRWERRRMQFAGLGYAIAGLAVAGLLAAWGLSYLRNDDYLARTDAIARSVAQQIAATPDRGTANLLPLLPALRATRDLASQADRGSWWMHFGLYQGDKLEAAASQAYRRMLVEGLQPRLAMSIEAQLRAVDGNRERLYEALKAYLMLFDAARFDAAALKGYVLADWERSLPRELGTAERTELEQHLDALLAQGAVVSPVPEDKALVAQVRSQLASMPLPERVYSRLKVLGVGSDQPEFTIAKAAGPNASLVFTRASGQPLTRGVPGTFTYNGYQQAFQRQVERVTQQMVAEEPWVLGVSSLGASASDPIALRRAVDAVRRLYLNEYASTWERFIGDIKLVPTGNLTQAVQMARILSAADGPLVPLVKALVRETTLSAAPEKSAVARAGDKAKSAIDESREQLAKIFGRPPEAGVVAEGQRIESIVDDRFESLRRLVTQAEGQGPPPMDAAVGLLNEVYTALVAADSAAAANVVVPVSDVPNKVKAQAARLPEPVRSVLTTLSTNAGNAAMSASRGNLGTAVRSAIGEFCRQAITGRYPFTRGSNRDVTQDDFARLFSVGGMFDDFFQKNLANFVDTSTRPWSFRQLPDGRLGGDPGTLAPFQRAAAIRDTFFRTGGKAPALRLEFKPLELDASITQFLLDVDGQVVRYAHGPQIPTTVQWPGPGGSGQVRVELSPQTSGASGMVAEGPWALFRLFDKVQIEPTDVPERSRVTFVVDGRKAVFQVTSSSVQNPFRLREMSDFACPGGI